jgi:hypothetical protein
VVDERDRSDAALDRWITETLDVDVAPDFVARVRTELAQSRAGRSWRAAWAFAPAAALGAIALVWLIQPLDRSVTSSAVDTVAAIAPAPSVDLNAVPYSEPVALEDTGVDRRTTPAPERSLEAPDPSAAEAAVIVDAREAIAFERFLTRVRDGQLTASMLPLARAESEELPANEIVIAPLDLKPLAFAADLQQQVEGIE